MKWKDDLRIRSVLKATGEVLHTWAPPMMPMVCDPNYDKEQNDRRLADGTDDPFKLGFRASIELTLYFKAGCMEGAEGFDSLEDVLSDESGNANVLELALRNAGTLEDPQWDWKRVYLAPGTLDIRPLEGKYVGLQADMTFTSFARQQDLPKRNGGAW